MLILDFDDREDCITENLSIENCLIIENIRDHLKIV